MNTTERRDQLMLGNVLTNMLAAQFKSEAVQKHKMQMARDAQHKSTIQRLKPKPKLRRELECVLNKSRLYNSTS